MVHFLPASDRPTGKRTIRFEGAEYGTPISFFAVNTEPGGGPRLHRHPYVETWIVNRGRASFVAGDQTFEAGPGDIAVVPAGVAHKFTALAPERLEMTCIHAAGAMEQVDLE